MKKASPPSRRGNNGAPPPPVPPRVWQGAKLAAVCASLEEGMPLAISCRLQGHEPDGLEELMARDASVRSAIEQARSTGQQKLIAELLNSGQGEGPRVAARTWLLERLNPKVFRQASKVENEITGKDGAPLGPAFTISIEAARELAAKGQK